MWDGRDGGIRRPGTNFEQKPFPRGRDTLLKPKYEVGRIHCTGEGITDSRRPDNQVKVYFVARVLLYDCDPVSGSSG